MTVATLIISLLAIGIAEWALRRARRRIRRTRRLVRQLEASVAELEVDRDRISAELDAAHLTGAALSDRYWRAERRAGRQLVRSLKRRAAIVRIARHCRDTAETLDVAIEAGVMLAADCQAAIAHRDAAIDAMTARIAALMPRETSASIAAWQNETFGPATTTRERVDRSDEVMRNAMSDARHANLYTPRPNLSRAIRAAEELAELIELLVADDNAAKAPEEVADIDIVLRGIDAAHGVERATMVDGKMAKNRARSWKLTGDGHGQHVESPCASLDAFFGAELYPDRAAAFRDHLATCERCQRVLDGRMQETVAAGRSGAEPEPT
jgi:hypothetical protein